MTAVKNYVVNPYIGPVIDGALISWLGGGALRHGFGVSIPFIAGWILAATILLFIFSASSHAAAAWQQQAVKAALALAAAATRHPGE
jgi:hypothetical protein